MIDDAVLGLVAKASEFQELKVRFAFASFWRSSLIGTRFQIRDDEMKELDELFTSSRLQVAGGVENVNGKVNVLLQSHISDLPIGSFSLISDMAYVVQVSAGTFGG